MPKLFIYTHKFGKYATFQCIAPYRNCANALLTLWADETYGKNYDQRNCDFKCEEIDIPIVIDDFIADRFIEMAIDIQQGW